MALLCQNANLARIAHCCVVIGPCRHPVTVGVRLSGSFGYRKAKTRGSDRGLTECDIERFGVCLPMFRGNMLPSSLG